MRNVLFPFQERALKQLHETIHAAHTMWKESSPQIISFSAPTGSGKTIIMTALFEEIFCGSAVSAAEPDSVFVWLSDSPELNEQSRVKIEDKSDKIHPCDLVTVDRSFDAEYFQGGKVYFLNTQKLGREKLLTQKSEMRQYTIWETFANTARRKPKRFYVVVDEAHRGTYSSVQAEHSAQTIIQKFIRGSDADGLTAMPLIIGVTATPQRFEAFTEQAASTVQRVSVPAEQVRASGLLKDKIIIHYPETSMSADITMFKGAVDDWKQKCALWNSYCSREGEKQVNPILVVQVEDGTGREATRTDLGACIAVLEDALGRPLRAGEVVHTFHDKDTIRVRGVEIKKIELSRIEEDEVVLAVFFKMNLSTGWDCPRAETMMSFRKAYDCTYIAQLLGRMIRMPLARRISSHAELNNVNLFLPYFDHRTVQGVVDALRDSESLLSIETGVSAELVILVRNPDFTDVFDAMGDLVTYRMEAEQTQSALRSYLQLSRALTMDGIDFTAWRLAKQAIVDKLAEKIGDMKAAGSFEAMVSELIGCRVDQLTFDAYSGDFHIENENIQSIQRTDFDITQLFEQAGRRLGESLHMEYWRANSDRNHIEVKIEIIVLVENADAMKEISDFAEQEFLALYETNTRAIAQLNEAARSAYERMARSSTCPVAAPWILPDSIDGCADKRSVELPNHLFVQSDGLFRTSLAPWELRLVRRELAHGAICWLRNLPHRSWSLEITYEADGAAASIFPSLVTVHLSADRYTFDVFERYDPDVEDSYRKALGLSRFMEQYWAGFGKIQLVRSADSRLDMSRAAVRGMVEQVTSNPELDRIFDAFAEHD